jgi:DNA-binding LacI/PurR family transcriptional regulator
MTSSSLGRRATIADVAALAGVSRSAVSRAFTLGASVSPQTRARIEQAAHALGFKPNALARGLTKQENRLVAFVAGYQHNLYDAGFHDLVLSGLQAAGFRVLLVHIERAGDVGRALLEALDYPVSVAVVAGGSIDEASISACIRLRTPIVLCTGEVLGIDGVDCINSDNAGGTLAALAHLIAGGRRRIACIAGTRGMFAARERLQAFHQGMQAHGLEAAGVEHGDFTFEGGMRAAQALLSASQAPDALLCCNDAMAIGALTAARELGGRRVPEDLAIIGFDDIPMASWPNFQLSTVRNLVAEKASLICERVRLRTQDSQCAAINQRFSTPLVVRRTA